jgi:Thioredoxin reductase
MYDTAIIGTGPAGLSAAINLKLHNRDFIWFGAKELSEKIEKSEKIANYPGLGLISGQELNRRMAQQAEEMELSITDKLVTSISKTKENYMVLAENEVYQAKTVLLAPGVVMGKSLEGEEELLGRGVSYCATCDGFLYKGKTIAVFCGSKKYEHEVKYLAEIAEKVWFYSPDPACDVDLPNVSKLEQPIKGMAGKERVEKIILSDGCELGADGVFILRNAVAPASLLPGLEMDGVHIVVDREQQTSYPGCFAAGDCTGRPYQIAKAVGEGNVAAHHILEFCRK